MNQLIIDLMAEGLWRLAAKHNDSKGLVLLCLLIEPDTCIKWIARHRNRDKSAKGEAIAAIAEALKKELNHPPD